MGGSTAFVTRVFDPARDSWVEPKWITGPEDAILVIDGRFVLRERLAALWDVRIAIDGDPVDPADVLAYAERDPRVVASAVIDLADPAHPARRLARPSVTGGVIAWSCTWAASRGIRIVRPARRRAPARERAVRRAARPRARARPARGSRGVETGSGCLAHDGPVEEVDLGGLAAAQALLGRARGSGTPPMRMRIDHGSTWPIASGSRAKSRSRRSPRPCSEPKRTPPGDAHPHGLAHRRGDDAAQPAVVDDVLHALARRSRATAFSMLTMSLVHCAPRNPSIATTGTALGQHAGDPDALGVGRAVAAPEIARGRRRDAHHARLGVVRGDDREQRPCTTTAGSRRVAVATPSSPFCTTTTGTPSMRAGVRRDRGLGVLRLRADEHEVGPRRSASRRRRRRRARRRTRRSR